MQSDAYEEQIKKLIEYKEQVLEKRQKASVKS